MVGAASEDDAVEVGRSIARNNLLKCAIHGEDPNWGRVLSAIGTTSAVFEPDATRRRHQRRVGVPAAVRSARTATWSTCATARCGSPPTSAAGDESAVIWANDLTADYVHENSAYSS